MIKTNFLDGQGLGNQLWVYAAVRGISKKLGVKFNIGGKEWFKGSSFLELSLTDSDIVQQQSFDLFKEKQYFDPELQYYASDYDSRVENIGVNTYVEGLFQSEKYFYEFTSFLSEWLPLSEKMKEYSKQFSDVCILNVRGGEYKRHQNLILPKSYWEDAILNVKKQGETDRFLIVTDDSAYAKYLFPELEVLKGGVSECYAALYGAQSLVVSNSSFSYFPIKTRDDNPLVIAPYQWSRFANNYNRWAAPCNVYSDWLWQDQAGVIRNYEECMSNVEGTRRYYESEYNVCTPNSAIQYKSGFHQVPNFMKNSVKKILSKFFPLKYG